MNNEERKLDFRVSFMPWGVPLLVWFLFFGLFCLLMESYILGYIYILIFVILGLAYGWDYSNIKKLLLKYNAVEMDYIDHTFLEEIFDENPLKSVDVKFDISELSSKNSFLLIKIPSSFIGEFKKYKRSLNSPTILGKKIYNWGDCDNELCVQNVLCFSKAEIKSTIEQVTKELYTAIEWLPKENGDQSTCIQKRVKFEWK